MSENLRRKSIEKHKEFQNLKIEKHNENVLNNYNSFNHSKIRFSRVNPIYEKKYEINKKGKYETIKKNKKTTLSCKR